MVLHFESPTALLPVERDGIGGVSSYTEIVKKLNITIC